MPFYAYKCDSCGHAKDVLQKMSDDPLTDCPACGAAGAFKKQVTAAGFQLKGSGWYVTDFRANGQAPAKAADGEGKAAAPAAAEGSDSGAKAAGADKAAAPSPAASPAASTASAAPAPAPSAASSPSASSGGT